jgi:peptide-methionine (R)-S-oxide reductase
MKYTASLIIVIGLAALAGCGTQREEPAATTEPNVAPAKPDAAAEPAITDPPPTQPEKIVKSDEQWKQELTPEQYRILRQAGTERAFSHPFHDTKKKGIYKCAGCGAELFRSNEKFSSGCGWPSFYDPATNDAIIERPDTSHGMVRTEVICARCEGHLGHVFNDAPNQPTGLRYCINGAALVHVPADQAAE